MSIELKICLVGSMSTGKTSITQRFATDEFLATQQATIGAAFVSRQVQHRNYSISLQLWDTAGQERLRSILGLYYRKAHAVLLCFDINEGCDDLPGWLNDIHQNCPQGVLVAVAANKVDIIEQQYAHNIPEAQRIIQDSLQQATEVVQYEGFDAKVFATSAKTGKGVNDVFIHIIDELINRYQRDLANQNGTNNNKNNGNTVVDLDDEQKPRSSGCC